MIDLPDEYTPTSLRPKVQTTYAIGDESGILDTNQSTDLLEILETIPKVEPYSRDYFIIRLAPDGCIIREDDAINALRQINDITNETLRRMDV